MLLLRQSFFVFSLFILFSGNLFAANERGISLKPIAPTGEQAQGDNWLFIVGIDNYLSWPRLSTAVNDAKGVRDVLLERYYFDSTRVIEFYDVDATRKNIMGGLVQLAKNVRPEDSVLMFYAGHGHLDSITKAGSWVPVESGTDEPSAWIKNNDIKDYLSANAIKAKHILLVSDSCFAGDFFRGQRGALPEVDDKVIKMAYQRASRQALTSGGVEPVNDSGFGGNSVFSHFFLSALRENTKPFLIPSDLFPRVKAGVAQNAEQFPQLGGLYGVGGQEGGEYVFFLKQNLSDPKKLAVMDAAEQARQVELERLRRMESEAAAAKVREQAEIAAKQRQLDSLDQQIVVLKQRLGSGVSAGPNEGLQTILAMVKQKEEQGQKLEALRKELLAEEMQRQAAIDKIKAAAWRKRRDAVAADVDAYRQIAESPYGKEMVDTAWQSLKTKYPEVAQVNQGDILALERALDIQRFADLGDGTVKDRETGLVWLRDNECLEDMKWEEATRAAESLASGVCGLSDGSVAGQWRIPSEEEFKLFFDKSRTEPALPEGHPFLHAHHNSFFWTSSTIASDTNYALGAHVYYGTVDAPTHKKSKKDVWPVRGGQ